MKTSMILKATLFATKKHNGQFRKVSGEPYVSHPILVSELVRQYKSSKNLESLIVAALLHDTLEDTNTTFLEISTTFSPMIAGLVLELTSDIKGIEKYGKNNYLKRKMIGMSSYALVIKLVDRLSNIMDNPTDKYCKDTIKLLNYISLNRKISNTHKKIIKDIKKIIQG